ncbi:hypothetical protein CRENPOLYSF1_400009 [Crenothrix polyspora]|uniref:Uncharacterized protein n=1 Tax=Crenothrix polyspora TaxID=360316 RepID=A0A1R4HAA3_9GAMM|nr:hypothetical protein CRENPOLYSF1_400009 [Crenothrix polyspora]
MRKTYTALVPIARLIDDFDRFLHVPKDKNRQTAMGCLPVFYTRININFTA